MEQTLIKRFAKNKRIKNDIVFDNEENIIQGGGGEGIIEGINYIYVLFN